MEDCQVNDLGMDNSKLQEMFHLVWFFNFGEKYAILNPWLSSLLLVVYYTNIIHPFTLKLISVNLTHEH